MSKKPMPPPVLVGTEMEIIFQWGNGEPIIFKKQKVTGDPQKDIIYFTLPLQYDGAKLELVNPNKPEEKFSIIIAKSGRLEQERAKLLKPKNNFKEQIRQLRKPRKNGKK